MYMYPYMTLYMYMCSVYYQPYNHTLLYYIHYQFVAKFCNQAGKLPVITFKGSAAVERESTV